MSTNTQELTCINCWNSLEWKSRKFCCNTCKNAYRNKVRVERICENCWKHFVWHYRALSCSPECRAELITKKWKETVMKKYWVDNVSKLDSVRKKFKSTMLDRYWVEHPSNSKELLERQHQLFLEKYWVDNPMKIKAISKKSIEWTIKTNMDKYWVPYYVMTQHCRDSSTAISKVNIKFVEFLNSKWIETETEFPIWNYSYDVKVWDTLIELNPFPYHNSTRSPSWEPKEKNYHFNKMKIAKENWYRCIMVWDWDDIDKIPYLLDNNKETIYARKCDVKQIEVEDCHDLFESYHMQWDTRKNKNNIYIWLYYNNELVECMSFGRPRYNKNYEWEILRLCSHKDYKIIWWANKIFKYFLDITNTNSVISYCDMSKFDWSVYEKLWFKLFKLNRPSKHWYCSLEQDNRKHITDNLLRQYWYDKIFWENFGKWVDNNELMKQRGYVEIYDCGQSTFVWVRELATQG